MEVIIPGEEKTCSNGKKIYKIQLFDGNIECYYLGCLPFDLSKNRTTLKQHIDKLLTATYLKKLSKSICRYYINNICNFYIYVCNFFM